jgi:hypothetical protein
MATRNRSTKQTRLLALIAGVQKHLPNASLSVYGTTLTGAQVVQTLQEQVTASSAIAGAKAAWQAAVKADTDPASSLFLTQLTQTLRIMYANSVETLADFGIAPPKARVVDPDTQVAAAAKARATRVARHTMGKNQKKDIKGTVAPAAPVPAGSSSASPIVNGSSGTTQSH